MTSVFVSLLPLSAFVCFVLSPPPLPPGRNLWLAPLTLRLLLRIVKFNPILLNILTIQLFIGNIYVRSTVNIIIVLYNLP